MTLENVGLRLKGNSSLRGLSGDQRAGGAGASVSADAPEDLPWLVRLDKYVDGQAYAGYTEFVIRSNRTETSLNEAVALELIGLSGLATQDSVPTRFRVNGGAQTLRLMVENPGDDWDEANFATDGVLYKAESGGDYSYRGDDPAAYEDVFDQETDQDTDNLTPLVGFLKFINESDDATFAAQLPDHLDVDAFATYLAVEELVAKRGRHRGAAGQQFVSALRRRVWPVHGGALGPQSRVRRIRRWRWRRAGRWSRRPRRSPRTSSEPPFSDPSSKSC